jgi:L-amino acid N-acyltransferase YncA
MCRAGRSRCLSLWCRIGGKREAAASMESSSVRSPWDLIYLHCMWGIMRMYTHRNAEISDLPRIVEIYNYAVGTRESTCDTEPVTVDSRRDWFSKHSGSRRPIWVTENAEHSGVIGYLAYGYFMNERPGYCITADLAVYLAPESQSKGLGSYLLTEAIRHAPSLGIEVFGVTIFGSNQRSLRLFRRHGFEQWGLCPPRVARLGTIERDLIVMGRRVDGSVNWQSTHSEHNRHD